MKEPQNPFNQEKDILFSRSIRAGKRIYYVDVKKTSKGEMYLAITESKKIVSGDVEMPQVNFEKHKIFVYPEDFEKFTGSLAEAMRFIYERQGPVEQRPDEPKNELKIDDLEF
ncbi:MAG: DUF3276 family protein [Actinomycetaceae bacterium]|nr:DUF3276 family protein [Actinomycetaceae bacterium]